MKYNDKQRQQISEETKGKVVESMQWDDEGQYWVMEFTDGTEACFRFMSELV